MIYNFSYRDREVIRAINKTVGKPFGLIDRFKLKGVGSSRFMLSSSSEEIQKRLPNDLSILPLSFELRPKGVIVHFKKYTEHYTWVIPYYRLTIYYSDNFSIYSEGHFMKIATSTMKNSHQKFLRKLLDLKSSYCKQFISI